jgi:hypothetical protein
LVTRNVRRDKLIMFGGVTTDRRASTQCDGEGGGSDPVGSGRGSPNRLRFCDSIPPFRTTFKASAAYSFPHDISERQLHRDSGAGRQRKLPGHVFGRGPGDHRQHHRGGLDDDQPG